MSLTIEQASSPPYHLFEAYPAVYFGGKHPEYAFVDLALQLHVNQWTMEDR